jgi:hypothetical protein
MASAEPKRVSPAEEVIREALQPESYIMSRRPPHATYLLYADPLTPTVITENSRLLTATSSIAATQSTFNMQACHEVRGIRLAEMLRCFEAVLLAQRSGAVPDGYMGLLEGHVSDTFSSNMSSWN